MSLKQLINQTLINLFGVRISRVKSKSKNSSLGSLHETAEWVKKGKIPPPILADIGAGGGIHPRFKTWIDAGIVHVISFDPNPKWGDLSEYHFQNYGLGHIDGEHDFSNVVGPGASSCLRPNYEELDRFTIRPYFEVQEQGKINLRRMDSLINEGLIKLPNYVKIDVQGFEFYCLSGFGQYLDDILCFEIEVHLEPIYEGEKSFFDIYRFLKGKGFILRDMRAKGKWDDEVIELDAFFSRKPTDDCEEKYLELWEQICHIRQSQYFTSEILTERSNLPKIDFD